MQAGLAALHHQAPIGRARLQVEAEALAGVGAHQPLQELLLAANPVEHKAVKLHLPHQGGAGDGGAGSDRALGRAPCGREGRCCGVLCRGRLQASGAGCGLWHEQSSRPAAVVAPAFQQQQQQRKLTCAGEAARLAKLAAAQATRGGARSHLRLHSMGEANSISDGSQPPAAAKAHGCWPLAAAGLTRCTPPACSQTRHLTRSRAAAICATRARRRLLWQHVWARPCGLIRRRRRGLFRGRLVFGRRRRLLLCRRRSARLGERRRRGGPEQVHRLAAHNGTRCHLVRL